MKVINLWGGPGAGKSTTAAGLFFRMKIAHMNVELVHEYAKDLVWDKRFDILSNDQLYISAKQNRRLARLIEHDVEWAVTDSPLLLGLLYVNDGRNTTENGEDFSNFITQKFSEYDNYNIFLNRVKPYVGIGRVQTEDEAKIIDQEVKQLLDSKGFLYYTVDGDESAPQKIMEILGHV